MIYHTALKLVEFITLILRTVTELGKNENAQIEFLIVFI